jgi:hypothetical protein
MARSETLDTGRERFWVRRATVAFPETGPAAGAMQNSDTGGDAPVEGETGAGGDAAQRKREATLQECVFLLRGPSDERRLVGLLLVTRLLSAQDNDTLKVRETHTWGQSCKELQLTAATFARVLTRTPLWLPPACAQTVADALGSQFLARLLLGASPGRGQPTGDDDVAAEGVALACVVCASLCRSPHNATCVEFYSPLLSPLVAVVQLPSQSPHARSSGAALDALAAVACASPAGALAVMLAGGFQAATAAMRAAGVSLPVLSLLGTMLDATTPAVATQHLHDLASALPFVCSAMESVAEDPAIGLHAVHVAAHILRLSADAAASDASAVPMPPWSRQLARGVVALLRARNLSSQARADCLSAASGAVDVFGSRWVTCLGGDLIAPLVEVIVVEATVALHHLVRQQPAAGDGEGSHTPHGFADDHRLLTLGACTALFTACLAALASQEEEEEERVRGASAAGSAHQVSPPVAQRALGSLERMAETMLDFLDEVTPGHRGPRPDQEDERGDDASMGDDAPAPRPWDDPVVMVALNAVAAFLVEVPVALRGKLLRIMPRVLAATVAATAPARCRSPAPDASHGALFPPPLAPLVLSLELATGAEDPDDGDNPSFDAPPTSTSAGRWGPNDPACALIDALVPMGVVSALCGLVAAGCLDGGGAETPAAGSNRTKTMRASLGVLSHIAARAVHAPLAATDPQAVEAAEHIARHVPEALAHVLDWSIRHPGVVGHDDALFAAAVVDLQPRVVRAVTAADVCALLEALEP